VEAAVAVVVELVVDEVDGVAEFEPQAATTSAQAAPSAASASTDPTMRTERFTEIPLRSTADCDCLLITSPFLQFRIGEYAYVRLAGT
jgi:hypothetical protein